MYRTVSGGMYFFLQGVLSEHLSSSPFQVGLVAGALNGVLLNPLSAIKYHAWTLGSGFMQSALHASREGGLQSLFRGSVMTVSRDAVFGVCYEVCRVRLRREAKKHMKKKQEKKEAKKEEGVESSWYDMGEVEFNIVADGLGAAIATVASSPMNYVRSMQYAHMTDGEPRRAWQQMKRLWTNARVSQQGTLTYLQQRLRIGWGTLRVAVGMATGQLVFNQIQHWHTDTASSTSSKSSVKKNV